MNKETNQEESPYNRLNCGFGVYGIRVGLQKSGRRTGRVDNNGDRDAPETLGDLNAKGPAVIAHSELAQGISNSHNARIFVLSLHSILHITTTTFSSVIYSSHSLFRLVHASTTLVTQKTYSFISRTIIVVHLFTYAYLEKAQLTSLYLEHYSRASPHYSRFCNDL